MVTAPTGAIEPMLNKPPKTRLEPAVMWMAPQAVELPAWKIPLAADKVKLVPDVRVQMPPWL